MRAVLDILLMVMDLYKWVLIIDAVLSMLVAFNVVNGRNQLVATIGRFTYAITEPVLRPIRKIVPRVNGVDLSAIILIILITFVQLLISYYVRPHVF